MGEIPPPWKYSFNMLLNRNQDTTEYKEKEVRGVISINCLNDCNNLHLINRNTYFSEEHLPSLQNKIF